MKYNNAVAGYNQTNIGFKPFAYILTCSAVLRFIIACYNQTNIGLKLSVVNGSTALSGGSYNQTNIGLKL